MTLRSTPPTNGKSIRMPSVQLELGKYVSLRPRKDGTFRVLFEVPPRLRPSGWLPAIPLPIEAPRTGDLADLTEIGRIQADARDLYDRLIAEKAKIDRPEVAVPVARTMPELNRMWQSSEFFKSKKPRTRQGYAYHAGLILQWSEAANHPPVAGLGRDRIEKFLALFDDRQTTKRHVKIVLKMLLDHAVAVNWRTDNPAAAIKVKAPKSRVAIWEAEDVDFYMWAVAVAGHPAIAAMILTEWEIGQRLTDVRLFRLGGEYSDNEGAFRFWQSKTESYVTIPVSERLQHMLRAIRQPDSLYLFVDPANGRPYAEQRLGHVFDAIRKMAKVGRQLQLRALRHSCVVQLARASCSVPEIASITGHSPYSVEQILARYLPRDNQVAWNAQQKRGLILGPAKNSFGTRV